MTTADPPALRPTRPAVAARPIGRGDTLPAWAVVPVVLVLAYVLSFTVRATALRLGADWPLSPWESALVVDAWRASTGQAVYHMPADGPATQMYGPLPAYVVGAVFRATGPNLWVPRFVPLALSLGAAALAGVIVGRRSGAVAGVLAAMLVVAAFFKAQAAMTRARPDAASAALSFAALAALYQGHRADPPGGRASRWAWTVGGTGLLLVAFGFKQPAALLAGVPLAGEVGAGLARGRVDRRSVGRACVPLGATAGTLAAVKLFWPVGWFYMVEVAAMYPIRWDMLVPGLATAAVQYGLLGFAAAAFRATAARATDREGAWGRVDAWCLAAIGVTFAFGLLAWAKVGGQVNSMLPFFLAGAVYAALALPQALRRLPALPPLGRGAAVAGVGLLVLVDLLGVRKSDAYARAVVAGHGGPAYRAVIETARTLPGVVVCPLDPTVELFARGTAGRNLYLETDAEGDRLFRPPTVVREMLAADWLVLVQASYKGDTQRALLADCGYKRRDPPASWGDGVYSLWERVGEPNAEALRLAAASPGDARRSGVSVAGDDAE